MLHFEASKIKLKIVVSKLKLWVWKVKLCLFQVKTTSQNRFWTTLESFWALWQHFQYQSQNLIFRHFLGRLEFCFDVNWRLCLIHQPENVWPIAITRSVWNLKIFEKHAELTNVAQWMCCSIIEGVSAWLLKNWEFGNIDVSEKCCRWSLQPWFRYAKFNWV